MAGEKVKSKKKNIFFRFGVFAAKARVLYLEGFNSVHIRIRKLHDKTYQKIGWYKKYSDKKITSTIHRVSLLAFIVSFVFFQGFSYLSPYFNLWNPETAQAGANSKIWTTRGDFNNGTTKEQVSISGSQDSDDASVSFADPQQGVGVSESGASLFDVHFTDANTGYAAGVSGTIRKTTNAGSSWSTLTSGTTQSLYAIHFTDVNTGYVVGGAGTILKTIDAGSSWSALSSGTAATFYDIYFTDANTGYVVGSGGTIRKTTNAGSSWGALASGTEVQLNSIYFTDANIGYVAGGYYDEAYEWDYISVILKTTNAGSSWSTLVWERGIELKSVNFTDANTGYVVGSWGLIRKTTNAGSSWSALTSGTTADLNSVYFTDANTGYVMGFGGTIRKTTNAGSSWSALTSGITATLYGFHFVDSNISYAAGAASTILKTTDAGASWNVLMSGTSYNLSGSYFTDINTGYAAGVSGTIRKTTNAGSSWSALTSGTTAQLNSVHFTDANTGYVVGVSGTIRKTTDAGSTWSALTSGKVNTLYDIYFIDTNIGYVVGSGGLILRTVTAGSTWDDLTSVSGTTSSLRSIIFTGSGTGYAVGSGGTIVKTVNGGSSWSALTSGTTAQLNSIHFTDSDTGYVVGDVGTIRKTTNAGVSWSALPSGTSATLYGVHFTDTNTGYAVGASGVIRKTTNAGVSWSALPSGTSATLYGVHFTDTNTGYAVGATGTILKIAAVYVSPGTLSNLKINAEAIASWSTISWNGTEPTNTNIKFQTRGASTEAGLTSATWQGLDGTASTYYETSGDAISTSSSEWLEIKLILESSDGANTPTLNDFTVTYDTLDNISNSDIILTKTDSTSLKDSSGNIISGGNPDAWSNSSTLRVTTNNLSCSGCANPPTNLRPEVEIKEVGTVFNGENTYTAEPGNTYVDIPGLNTASYHLRVRSIDDQGRISAWTNYGNNDEAAADISIDQTPPTGTVTIGGDNVSDNFARSRNVTLILDASDSGGSNLSEMRFSNDGTTWSDWETYATTKDWTLAEGDDGERTVYAQFRDNGGNVSGTWVQTMQADFDLTGNEKINITTVNNEIKLTGGSSGQETMRPSGVGSLTTLAGNPSGSANWERVNEEIPDGFDSYVYNTTYNVWESDLYATVHSIPAGSIVNSVTLYFNIRASNVYGSGSFKPLLKDSVGTWTGDGYYNEQWTSYNVVRDARSDGSGWTLSDIDNLELGGSLYHDVDYGGATLTQIYAVIDWVKLPPPYNTSGTFASPSRDNITPQNYGAISWSADVPTQAGADALRFQVASNNDNATWSFIGPDGTSDSYYTSSGTQLQSFHNGHRYIRYKAYLQTADVGYTPIVYDVSIETNTTISDSITLDTQPPSDVANLKAYSTITKTNELSQNTWYPISEPYFEWDENTDVDFDHFKYCFSTTASCTPSVETVANSWSVSPTISFEGTHYFRVVAVDAAGNTSSNVATFIYKYDATAPGAVTGLSASKTQNDRINVSWNAYGDGAAPVENYKLERVKDSGNQYQIGDDWTSGAGYAIFILTANSFSDVVGVSEQGQVATESSTQYQYRISVKDVSNPDYSIYQITKVYGMTNDILAPNPVTGVQAVACNGTLDVVPGTSVSKCSDIDNVGFEVAIVWNPTTDSGTGVAGYKVYRSNTGGSDTYQEIASVGVLSNFYYDNDINNDTNETARLNDYTTYYYRVTAFDAATTPNETNLVQPPEYINYAQTQTPDVTPPTTPGDVSATPLGIDPSGTKQRIEISWYASSDLRARSNGLGSGINEYRIYRDTSESGDFNDLVGSTSDLSIYDDGLDDFTYYFYRVYALDNSNNLSNASEVTSARTASSAVPTVPTDVTVSAVKGDPAGNNEVGDVINISFKGSYAKNCLNNERCLVKYELYRSTTNYGSSTDWLDPAKTTKVKEYILSGPVQDDRDTIYSYKDTNLDNAKTYYYRVRALDNTPADPDGGPFYSGLSTITTGTLNRGWDTTPDTTRPEAPVGGLVVKVKDTHPNDSEYRNIITWLMIDGEDRPSRNKMSYESGESCEVIKTVGGVNYCNDFARYEIHREVLDPGDDSVISDTLIASINDITENYYIDKLPLALGALKYRYYIQIVDNAATEFKYQNGTIINGFSNFSVKQYAEDTIIPDKARPTLTQPIRVSSVGVSSAVITWETDQDADTIVEFRPAGSSENWEIDGRVERTTYHEAKLVNMKPDTTYEYRIVSRNYLGNNIEYNPVSLPTLKTTGFNITPGNVKTTTTTAEINWTTNLNASSAFVEYQLQRQVGDEPHSGTAGVSAEDLGLNAKNHKVILKGLRSNRTYTYKIKSISTDGYLAEYPTGGGSKFEDFRTKAFDSGQFTLAPSSTNVAERNITSTNAQIIWQTATPTTTWVDYGTRSGVYDVSAGNNDLTTQHVVMIDGLTPGQTYYYRVRVKDANEVEYTSKEYSFRAVLKPKISNLQIVDITPYSVTIKWDTNIETETLINWGKTVNYGEKRGIPGMTKSHELVIDDLMDDTEYHFQILARDELGEEVADSDKIVRTPMDKEGPKIENVKIDLMPIGESDETAQVIISWNTNKPATTKVEYDEGLISGSYSKSSIEDTTLSTSHTVIIKGLNPATTYHFRMISKDRRDNTTYSNDYNFVTPEKNKSIWQLIVRSLEETFGWVSNVGDFFKNIGRKVR